MDNATTLMQTQGMAFELMRAQSKISAAKSRLRSAPRLMDVVREKQVNVPYWLMPVLRLETSGLHIAAEQRAKELVDEVLANLAELEGDEFKRHAGAASREFLNLPGHFPRLARNARQDLHALAQQMALNEAQGAGERPRERA